MRGENRHLFAVLSSIDTKSTSRDGLILLVFPEIGVEMSILYLLFEEKKIKYIL